MEQVFEQIVGFALLNGWQLALMAILGIVLLGVLKYANVFKNIEQKNRKMVYLAISIGFSLTSATIYLLIVKQFDIKFLIGISGTIYALNQAMYSIYENTKLRDLLVKLLEILKAKFKKGDDSK